MKSPGGATGAFHKETKEKVYRNNSARAQQTLIRLSILLIVVLVLDLLWVVAL